MERKPIQKKVGIIPLRSNIYFLALPQLNGFEKGSWTRRLLLLPPRLLGQRPDIKSHAGGGALAYTSESWVFKKTDRVYLHFILLIEYGMCKLTSRILSFFHFII
jgi:hypothetical protein